MVKLGVTFYCEWDCCGTSTNFCVNIYGKKPVNSSEKSSWNRGLLAIIIIIVLKCFQLGISRI